MFRWFSKPIQRDDDEFVIIDHQTEYTSTLYDPIEPSDHYKLLQDTEPTNAVLRIQTEYSEQEIIDYITAPIIPEKPRSVSESPLHKHNDVKITIDAIDPVIFTPTYRIASPPPYTETEEVLRMIIESLTQCTTRIEKCISELCRL
jgi:hypothetical protein